MYAEQTAFPHALRGKDPARIKSRPREVKLSPTRNCTTEIYSAEHEYSRDRTTGAIIPHAEPATARASLVKVSFI